MDCVRGCGNRVSVDCGVCEACEVAERVQDSCDKELARVTAERDALRELATKAADDFRLAGMVKASNSLHRKIAALQEVAR